MRYASIIENDMVNGEGVCVSFWTQGCPHRCPGCHNPETWDFEGGTEIHHEDLFKKIDEAMTANNIPRNFSVLGGEPLCKENFNTTAIVVGYVHMKYPDRKIFLWTGYEIEHLPNNRFYNSLLSKIDVLITGPYKEECRDISQKWIGSTNQEILYKGIDF